MVLLWWHWAVIGFGFLMAELMFPAFIMLWFGLCGFLVALMLFLAPETTLDIQLFFWILTSCVMTAAWFRFFKDKAPRALSGRASAAILGEVGMITEAVAPFKEGKIRFQKPIVGSDVWDCSADEALSVGTRAAVVRIEGNKVVVQKTGDVS